MKLCINCRWHQELYGVRIALCVHPSSVKPSTISPVDGREEAPPPEFCSTLRAEYGKCGIDAKLFEEKIDPGSSNGRTPDSDSVN
jgi:hypothetical protein